MAIGAVHGEALLVRVEELARSNDVNYLFMGSVGDGKAAAIAYSLIETAKMNGIDLEAWLAWVLERLPDHKTMH